MLLQGCKVLKVMPDSNAETYQQSVRQRRPCGHSRTHALSVSVFLSFPVCLLSPSLSLSLSVSLSLSLSLVRTRALSLSLLHTLSHTHSLSLSSRHSNTDPSRWQLGDSAPPLRGAQIVSVNGEEVLGMTIDEVMSVITKAESPGVLQAWLRVPCCG